MFSLVVGCVSVSLEGTVDSDLHTDATVGPLVSMDAWVLLDDDPLRSQRPNDAVVCGPNDYAAEPVGFEVVTEACNWATFGQPLSGGLRAHDVLDIGIAHLDLWAAEPAEAVLAIGTRDRELWRLNIDIPATAAVYSEQAESVRPAEDGDQIWFHVHNHGTNSYRLTRLARAD